MERYSKDLSDYLSLVGHQTSDASYRDEADRMDRLYIRGQRREECSNCNASLKNAAKMTRRSRTGVSIVYFLCPVCRHISGAHQISPAFVHKVYGVGSDNIGLYDTDFYFDQDKVLFERRVTQIYRPKADFFAGTLMEQGIDPRSIEVLDVGAGAGHMVRALREVGFSATGIEVSKAALRQADSMDVTGMHLVNPQDLADSLAQTDATAISMVCLLPHVERVDDVMMPILANHNIRFVFQLLPLASLSAMLSIAAGSLTARVLSGSHTHLNTLESLNHLEKRLGVDRIGSWWFGTDSFSLYELLSSGLQSSAMPEGTVGDWNALIEPMLPVLNALQMTLDSTRYCDQVHLVWQIPRS